MRSEDDVDLTGPNDPTVTIELWTSPSANGTYVNRGTLVDAAKNTVANTWEQFSGTLDASTLSAYAGEYLQIRIARNNNIKQRTYLEDCLFDAYLPDSFNQWATSRGINRIALAYDNDNDGFSNSEEYVLGGDPQSDQSVNHAIVFERDGANFTFTYPRRKESNLNYTVETSSDLNGSWTTGGATELPVTESYDSDFDKVENTVPTGANVQFIRVKAEAN
jgi:hypothetical protein